MKWRSMAAVPAALLLAAAGCVPSGEPDGRPRASGPFPYDRVDAVLSSHVDSVGLVDYRGLREDPRFAEVVAAVEGADPQAMEEGERLAFWIDAYNLLVLQGVLRYYPVRSVLDTRLLHGFFNRESFRAAGRDVTLDDIEHGILRKQFHEPRIHFALVCGAVSCPPLRREAYRPQVLDAQLDDQARRFLRDPQKNRLDRREGVLYLSSIFDWYGGDMAPDRASLVRWILPYLPSGDAAWLRTHPHPVVRYLPYDWSLNDQAGASAAGPDAESPSLRSRAPRPAPQSPRASQGPRRARLSAGRSASSREASPFSPPLGAVTP